MEMQNFYAAQQEAIMLGMGTPNLGALPLMLPNEVSAEMLSPMGAVYLQEGDFSYPMNENTIYLNRTNPRFQYALFDADANHDVMVADWQCGNNGTIKFTNLDDSKTYALRARFVPMLNTPMMTAPNPSDPPEILPIPVLPMPTDTDVLLIPDFDNKTGFGIITMIVQPGCRYALVDMEDPRIPIYTEQQRLFWQVKMFKETGEEIPADMDGYWNPQGLVKVHVQAPAGGTYRVGGITKDGVKFVSKQIVTLDSVRENVKFEFVIQKGGGAVSRAVVDPACPTSIYAPQYGRFAEVTWQTPVDGRVVISFIPNVTARLSVAAMPRPFEGMPK